MRFLSYTRWLPLCFLTSCTLLGLGPKGLNLAPEDQARLERLLIDREYVLASTVTGGEFFGQNDKYFADPRPFEILEFERHNGERAPVRMVTKMTLPAGTPVVLKEIIYPFGALDGAMDESRDPFELAPTAHTWLVVENTSREGVKTTLVLVLPKDIPDAKTFEAEVRSRLVSPMWVSTWLSLRTPEVLNAIYQKNVLEGMSRSEVSAALGAPRNPDEAETDAMSFEADYGDLQILFEGGIVSRVRSLKVEAELARLEAEKKAKQAALAAEEKRREEEALAAQKALEEAEKQKARAEAEKEHAAKLAKLEQERQAAVAAAQEARRARVIKAAPTDAKPSAKPQPVRVDLESEASESPAVAATPAVAPFVLGARVKELTAEKAKELGLRKPLGVLVIHIRARGAALKMGLRNDDVIISVNKKPVRKPADLGNHIKKLTAKDAVSFQVWRAGKTVNLQTNS